VPETSVAGAAERAARRAEVVDALADAVGTIGRPGPVRVALDALGHDGARSLADDLAAALSDRGRRCRRASLDAFDDLYRSGPARRPDPARGGPARPPDPAGPRPAEGDEVLVIDGSFLQHAEFVGAWDLVIFVRDDAAVPARTAPTGPDRGGAVARYLAETDPEAAADVVVDLFDPGWPVIRRIDPAVADRIGRDLHRAETLAFFAPRAASWEDRFPEDEVAYATAVADLGVRAGQTALDVACGTGRALPHLRRAVGPAGTVVGLDLTPEMLATARRYGRHADAALVLADARRLPVRDDGVDAVFAAGLLPHLPRPAEGLAELARVVRPGGVLGIFHPSSRVALAARHGRSVRDTDLLARPTLRRLLESTGWSFENYEDGPDRFLAIATRTAEGAPGK
jgi:SAM-dependent methyltransferase